MTNDYYINLTNYYTNQLVSGTPSESITLTEPYTNMALKTYLQNIALEHDAIIHGLDGTLTWDGSNNIILYGYFIYLIDDVQSGGGFIVRLPYKNGAYDISSAECYTTYEGGTLLPIFNDLKVDNDGSLYGIIGSGGDFSLIMLGNPFISGGIKFRKSYAFPSGYSSYTNYQETIKKENTGEYLFIVNDGNTHTLILHLTINVGIPNDWVATTYSSSVTVYDYYIAWGNSISLYLLTTGSDSTYLYVLYFDGSTVTQQVAHKKAGSGNTLASRLYNSTTIYYIVSYLSGSNAINELYRGDLSTGNNTLMASSSTAYSVSSPTLLLFLMTKSQQIEIVDGIVYFNYLIPYGESYGYKTFGVIIGDDVYTLLSNIQIAVGDLTRFIVLNTYNIHKMLMPTDDYMDIVEFQYDPNGFNGTPYIDTNMFIPYRVELYDDDVPGKLLFDRGLYNLKVYGNVTESTFNVPYTMLNSDTIQQAKLYGETNYNLVDNYINVNKNIYENLMINFFNSIVVKDYTGRIYNSGGSRVNDSISKTNDMKNASVNKIKLFYSDNTTYTYGLPAPTITGGGNPMTATYEIPLVVNSDGYVLKYQILSNDENTLYFEYDTSSLNAGTYKITQECSVE